MTAKILPFRRTKTAAMKAVHPDAHWIKAGLDAAPPGDVEGQNAIFDEIVQMTLEEIRKSVIGPVGASLICMYCDRTMEVNQ